MLRDVSSQLRDEGYNRQADEIDVRIDEVMYDKVFPTDNCSDFKNCAVWKKNKDGCFSCGLNTVLKEIDKHNKEK